MADALRRPRKTVEDYLALPDEVRAELIDGDLYMTPSPKCDHQRAGFRLARLLADWADRTGAGEVFHAPFDVHLPSGDVVQPDVLFVSAANAAIVSDWIHGAPDLVVEVLSPPSPERDRIVKRALYALSGVPEYWIVDPEARSLETFHLRQGQYVPTGWFTDEALVITPTYPSLTIPLRAVFPT